MNLAFSLQSSAKKWVGHLYARAGFQHLYMYFMALIATFFYGSLGAIPGLGIFRVLGMGFCDPATTSAPSIRNQI
jgi:hypothetical protein